jgi:hypothetical protein
MPRDASVVADLFAVHCVAQACETEFTNCDTMSSDARSRRNRINIAVRESRCGVP